MPPSPKAGEGLADDLSFNHQERHSEQQRQADEITLDLDPSPEIGDDQQRSGAHEPSGEQPAEFLRAASDEASLIGVNAHESERPHRRENERELARDTLLFTGGNSAAAAGELERQHHRQRQRREIGEAHEQL